MKKFLEAIFGTPEERQDKDISKIERRVEKDSEREEKFKKREEEEENEELGIVQGLKGIAEQQILNVQNLKKLLKYRNLPKGRAKIREILEKLKHNAEEAKKRLFELKKTLLKDLGLETKELKAIRPDAKWEKAIDRILKEEMEQKAVEIRTQGNKLKEKDLLTEEEHIEGEAAVINERSTMLTRKELKMADYEAQYTHEAIGLIARIWGFMQKKDWVSAEHSIHTLYEALNYRANAGHKLFFLVHHNRKADNAFKKKRDLKISITRKGIHLIKVDQDKQHQIMAGVGQYVPSAEWGRSR